MRQEGLTDVRSYYCLLLRNVSLTRKNRNWHMSRRTWKQWLVQQFGVGKRSPKPHRAPRKMAFETLDQRLTPAVNAFFGGGILTVFGDHLNNTIDVSRDAAGKLLVNG